jgi:hypothetical protein
MIFLQSYDPTSMYQFVQQAQKVKTQAIKEAYFSAYNDALNQFTII